MHLAEAMEVLELIDVDQLTPKELQLASKKARKRWHPDNIAWRKDPDESARYTRSFQCIDKAVSVLEAYLAGSYQTGEKTRDSSADIPREPVEIIRENAAEMKEKILSLWEKIKQSKYRWTTERTVVSTGRKLSDMLQADFDDEIASMSAISLFYGGVVFAFTTAMCNGMSPALGIVAGTIFFVQILSCLMGMLPLSRYWLNAHVQTVMLWFVNFGLRIFHWTERAARGDPWWAQLLVALPALCAFLFKHLLFRPLVFFAKIAAKDRMVGAVEKNVNYYAGFADWYVEQLLAKPTAQMTEEELFHLSHLYKVATEFGSR